MASAVTFKPSVKASLLKSINKRNAELSFSVTPRTKPTASKFKKAGVLITKAEVEIVTTSKGLDRSGINEGGRWLNCTTRHIRIYVGAIDPISRKIDQSQIDKLTLMVDPDNEFLWPDETLKRVYDEFGALIDQYEGADLTEYTLRLIGSDLEHFIRKMLLAGELEYNMDCRVLNFSMGKPRYEGLTDTI